MAKTLIIGPDHHLIPKEIVEIAESPAIKVKLSSLAKRKIIQSRRIVEKIVSEHLPVYGITTGFGKFKDKSIGADGIAALQVNLIRSHSAGVGPILSPTAVRAALLVRINSLALGYSGVRLEFLAAALGLLNKNVIPVIPSQGSVGASGDLAPLSHIGLVLMGEGEAFYKGERLSGKRALNLASLKPITFTAKEGLAWNNGTAVMTGIASLALHYSQRLADAADLACALTLEGVTGMSIAFDPRVHKLRLHPGQFKSAKNIRELIQGSKLIDSFPKRIQDSYSIRCAPQVHGAVRDAVDYIAEVLERELNSVTDNPLIFSQKPYGFSAGNFHGQPVSIAMDFLRIAVASLANISERRTAKLVDAATSEGLPMFLIHPDKAGLHSGLMMIQYTAAALVSENKILTHPASVDSIPTSANQEDHVSMGTISARKTLEVVENTQNVLAIELLTAAQAIDFRGSGKLGRGTKSAYRLIRQKVAFLKDDRELTKDIERMAEIMRRGVFSSIL